MAVAVVIFLVLPLIELWVMLQVAGAIGAFWTIVSLVALSVLGFQLLRGGGPSVWRKAQAELAAGRTPTRSLLDGALLLVGAVCLIVPGFVTGAFGLLLVLPPVRAVLRPVLLGWMTRRAARLARSGRLRGVMVDTVVDADGRVTSRTRTMGQVIDAEGWDVGEEPIELPGAHRPVDHGADGGRIIDVTGSDVGDPGASGRQG